MYVVTILAVLTADYWRESARSWLFPGQSLSTRYRPVSLNGVYVAKRMAGINKARNIAHVATNQLATQSVESEHRWRVIPVSCSRAFQAEHDGAISHRSRQSTLAIHQPFEHVKGDADDLRSVSKHALDIADIFPQARPSLAAANAGQYQVFITSSK